MLEGFGQGLLPDVPSPLTPFSPFSFAHVVLVFPSYPFLFASLIDLAAPRTAALLEESFLGLHKRIGHAWTEVEGNWTESRKSRMQAMQGI